MFSVGRASHAGKSRTGLSVKKAKSWKRRTSLLAGAREDEDVLACRLLGNGSYKCFRSIPQIFDQDRFLILQGVLKFAQLGALQDLV